MIWLSCIHFIALILHCCPPTASAEKDADSPENRDGLIREAMKSFLGVKDSLEPRADSKKKHPDPPRYMLDLYRSYKRGQMLTRGNTVRSILSMRGRTENVEMLVFNLTGIQAYEQIFQGKLHLYTKRRSKSHRKKDPTQYRLKVKDLVAPRENDAQVINISLRQKQGWKSFDVTKAVIKCRSMQRNGDYLLTVSAESLRPNGKYRTASLKKVLRLASQPFLIIFSEDRNNRNEAEDEADKDTLSVIEDLLREVRNGSDRITAKDVITERRKRSPAQTESAFRTEQESKDYEISAQQGEKQILYIPLNNTGVSTVHATKAFTNSVLKKILRQTADSTGNGSIADERLTITGFNQNINFEHSHMQFSQRRIRNRLRRHWRRSLASNDVSYDTADSSKISEMDRVLEKYSRKIDPNIIPLPRSMDEREMLPWHHRRKRRKHRKLPFWWIKHEGKQIKHNMERVCQRKKLVVDFASIGWNEWVISPKSFESYYCSGRCSFPLIKNGRPSNHATIQSLVQAMNRDLLVPAPCCVPSTTSSLTLLYFDENRNVVLKNYPNMIVERCACR